MNDTNNERNRFKELWSNSKRTNIYIRVPEWERKDCGAENIFEETMKLSKFSVRRPYRLKKMNVPLMRYNFKIPCQDKIYLNFKLKTKGKVFKQLERNDTLLIGTHWFK